MPGLASRHRSLVGCYGELEDNSEAERATSDFAFSNTNALIGVLSEKPPASKTGQESTAIPEPPSN